MPFPSAEQKQLLPYVAFLFGVGGAFRGESPDFGGSPKKDTPTSTCWVAPCQHRALEGLMQKMNGCTSPVAVFCAMSRLRLFSSHCRLQQT